MAKFYLSIRRYLTVFLVCGSLAGFAQQTVTGKVTSSDDGSGVPGVNVLEKGTSNGTVTDADGNFKVSVGSNATLVFSFVGFSTQEAAVGSQSTINISLVSDVTALSEVVVVGYGTQEKKEISGSVVSVKAEDFNKGNVPDPAQLLAGKVPGLNISRAGGDPNEGFNIRLRGLSTVGANTQPLIVIDGVIGADLRSVDPNDIASMDVLKDGSAAAIYGTRGSSGVILITTKKGKSGKTTVEYNGSVSAESIAKSAPMLSSNDFRNYSNETGYPKSPIDFGANTDWVKAISQTARIQSHNIALSGGTSQTTYRASATYRDQQGVQQNTGFKQLITSLSVNQKALDDKLNLSLSVRTTSKLSQLGFTDAWRYAATYNPTAPIYHKDDPDKTVPDSYNGYFQRANFDFYNPVSIIKQNVNEGENKRLNVSFGGNYEITPGLNLNLSYAFQQENFTEGRYISKYSFYKPGDIAQTITTDGVARKKTWQTANQLFEGTLNYTKSFGDLNLNVLGGYSYQDFENQGLTVQAGGFLNDATSYNNIGTASDVKAGKATIDQYRNTSKLIARGFGRVNLNFKETYFLSASVRNEGSSKFGANNKWGTFPAVSGSAILSNLFDLPGINFLKVKIGYGVTGNIPNDSYLSQFLYAPGSPFLVNGSFIPGYGPNINANPNLKWERKSEINYGLEFRALDSRLTGTVEYYTRTTKDLIFLVAVPQPPNLAASTNANVGSFQNSGIEAALNYAVIQGSNFSWNTGINFATLTTKFLQWNHAYVASTFKQYADVGSPGQNSTYQIRVDEGKPVGQIWTLKYQGVNPDGTWKFQDVNGDGVIDDNDRVVVGNGLPKVTFGFINTFRYGKWDLNFLLRGATGHKIINQYRTFYESPQSITSYNLVKTSKDWSNLLDASKFNDVYVEKGDFVKLDNLTLGYNVLLPTGSKISRLRIYGSGQNLFTITKYKGIDPEVRWADPEDTSPTSANPLSPGIERRGTWARTKTFTLGLNLAF